MITKPRYVDKPWGHERIISETDKYVSKIIEIDPYCRLSRQVHFTKDESFYVLEGSMNLEISQPGEPDYRTYQMTIGDCFHCPPGIMHRMWAGQRGCVIVETSTPHLDDIERIEDDYGRA